MLVGTIKCFKFALLVVVAWSVECAIISRPIASHRGHFGTIAGRLRVHAKGGQADSSQRLTVPVVVSVMIDDDARCHILHNKYQHAIVSGSQSVGVLHPNEPDFAVGGPLVLPP